MSRTVVSILLALVLVFVAFSATYAQGTTVTPTATATAGAMTTATAGVMATATTGAASGAMATETAGLAPRTLPTTGGDSGTNIVLLLIVLGGLAGIGSGLLLLRNRRPF